MSGFAGIGKAVICSGGKAVARVDYSRPGHPRRVHEDGTTCGHDGPVLIADKDERGDARG